MALIAPEELAAIQDILGDPEASRCVSAEELAEWIGVTPNRIHTLGREGTIPRNVDKTFPLRRAVLAYAEHARQGALGRRADGELAQEKIRLARESADKIAIANARARGELIASAEVARAWGEIVTDLRAAVLAVPSRVASRLGLDRHASAALDAEIRQAMEVIADD